MRTRCRTDLRVTFSLAPWLLRLEPAKALEVAMVGVNDLLLATAEMPFGGVRSSGTDREGGRLSIFDCLDAKHTKLKFA